MEINDICFSYDKKTDLLKNINASVDSGTVTTIVGPNGSGKSTLLAVMSKNLSPRSGAIILDGKELESYKSKELAKKLAVVHQHNEAPSDITVEKLTNFGRLPYKSLFRSSEEEDKQMVEWALTCTDLIGKRNKRIVELSGGERQRVWIAMALAQKTPILFLDEPTTYLDIYHQFEILELVKQLNKEHGLTIVMVLHDINQAIRYSDSIMVMKDGTAVLKGTPSEVITEETMRRIYGVDVVIKQDEHSGMYIVPLGINKGSQQVPEE